MTTTDSPRHSISSRPPSLPLSSSFNDSPEPTPHNSHFIIPPPTAQPDSDEEDAANLSFSSDNENDTASQKSISLSSPARSPVRESRRQSLAPNPFDHSMTSKFSPSSSFGPIASSPSPSEPVTTPTPADPVPTPVSLIRESLTSSSLASRKRESQAQTLSSESSSQDHEDDDDRSEFMRRLDEETESPFSSAAPSILEKDNEAEERNEVALPTVSPLPSTVKESPTATAARQSLARPPPPAPPALPPRLRDSASIPPSSATTYPPPPIGVSLVGHDPSRDSMASYASSVASVSSESSAMYSKKARPESLLLKQTKGPIVCGLALVDFNHLVGPKIEFSRGAIFDNEDDELTKILPFLALPDGAHLTTEDYSYFHLVPSSVSNPTTLFGISCNRQIKSAELLTKHPDVTRSTVQKAVVVLATKPVFGPIRARLGVITRALFEQKDFSDLSILDAFYESLEGSLKGQLTESGFYMGTSLRELVHTFRQRTLVLLKALMLQKKLMFYGHPVERLCTYQYSLTALVPGLLHNLDDSGSPPLAARAKSLSRPSELRTSDPKSVLAYVGLPLDLFGKDAFFQPYLPLQQLDMLKDTQSWLCGSTNSIVAQQKEVDLLVNIETNTFEFRDPRLERLAGLTPADRKWMDDIVRDVNDSWVDGEEMGGDRATASMHFKGSDDYLRQKFEEYIVGALASVKYADFLTKGQGNGVIISDGSGDPNSVNDFNMLWIQEFKKTNAYEVWERVTDPLLFDIVEPRHPCNERPSVVADISLRLTEGIQDLKLEQQLAPTREAISRTLSAGSTNFFKAVEGVRGRWLQRAPSSDESQLAPESISASNSPSVSPRISQESTRPSEIPAKPVTKNGMRPLSLVGSASISQRRTSTISQISVTSPPPPVPPVPALPATPDQGGKATWGSGIASFFSARAPRFSGSNPTTPTAENSAPARALSPLRAGSTRTASSRRGSTSSSIVSLGPRKGSVSDAASIHSVTAPNAALADLGLNEIQPKDLDKEFVPRSNPHHTDSDVDEPSATATVATGTGFAL
ncbi:late secretory pathway protein avl9 [Steccherinum ochraceum]|uniref:Late secretory pathway protein avl9 n=1 Tax=Steccherinum ochraceum TaxID=92696 RepID=A0A4R0RJE2_9APHY|nr:late secretory pathway protein avl9 [Steccherinum ochraceum]